MHAAPTVMASTIIAQVAGPCARLDVTMRLWKLLGGGSEPTRLSNQPKSLIRLQQVEVHPVSCAWLLVSSPRCRDRRTGPLRHAASRCAHPRTQVTHLPPLIVENVISQDADVLVSASFPGFRDHTVIRSCINSVFKAFALELPPVLLHFNVDIAIFRQDLFQDRSKKRGRRHERLRGKQLTRLPEIRQPHHLELSKEDSNAQ